MILSNVKVNKLLEIFATPKTVNPYDNTIEKEGMENAKKFINNYHIYGPPLNYSKSAQTIFNNNKNNDYNAYIYDTNSYISQNKDINLENQNNNEILLKKSIANLRLGQKKYKNEQQLKGIKNNYSKSTSNIFGYKNSLYNNISSENNNNIINSIYKNSINPNYLFNSNYNSNINGINNSQNYSNNKHKFNSKIGKSSKLKDIPPNPEDVIIKELPNNYMNVNESMANFNLNYNQLPISSTIYLNKQNNAPSINNSNFVENNQPQIEEINTNVYKDKNEIKENLLYKSEDINNDNIIVNDNEKEEPEEITATPPTQTGKYKITAFNGPIKLPEGYSTDDIDEYNAIQNINDDLSNWKLVKDKPNYKIYCKPFKTINEKGEEGESRMFYLDATIDHPASKINEQLNSFQLRQQWEEYLKKGKLIKEENLGNGIKIIDYYGYIKMPMIFSDRDIVVRKKIWENYNNEKDCCLNELHSIENPEYPPKKKPVRATLENKSKFVKPIDANRSRFIYVNKFDMKLNAGGSMMESKGADGTEKWFKEFLKHLE